jgi:dTDP-4-amino-4,6-dideoxygalactose transaminase
MRETVLMALAPLDPRVWLSRRRGSLPFPLDQECCRLFSRGRHGLGAGLRALGIAAADEILAPAYHHGSEIEALQRAGARCVFYEPGDGLAPDAGQLDALLTARTRALHLTHHLGFPQDAARWRRWCDARGLALIEDAAQAWLARVGDRPAGAIGDLAIFSLYKTFGLPDGGALHCPAGAPGPRGRRDTALLRLGLEHAAWVAGRSRAIGGLVTRLRPQRRYDPAADFALGAPRPTSTATLLALRRAIDPGAADRRRDNYELLLRRLADIVPPPFDVLAPGACPLVLPVRATDKTAFLRRLRAAGVRALDLWSVPHPSLDPEQFPRAAELRRTLVGLPVHQELRSRDLDRIAVVARAAGAS